MSTCGSSRSRRCRRRTRSISRSRRSKASRSSSSIDDGIGNAVADAQGAARRAADRARPRAERAGELAAVSLPDDQGRRLEPRDRVHGAGDGAGRRAPTPRSSRTIRSTSRSRCPPIARSCTRGGRRATSTASRSRPGAAARSPRTSTRRATSIRSLELFVDGKSVAVANKTKKGGEEKVTGVGARGWQRGGLREERGSERDRRSRVRRHDPGRQRHDDAHDDASERDRASILAWLAIANLLAYATRNACSRSTTICACGSASTTRSSACSRPRS